MSNVYTEIVGNFFNSKNRVVVIRHYNNFYLDLEELDRLKTERQGLSIMYKDFNEHCMRGPYEPFLHWIRKLTRRHGVSVQELLDSCDVYSIHREVFASYFSDGVCVRTETPLLNEIAFEKQLFTNEVVRMMTFLSKYEPLCIVFENVNNAAYSTLEVLRDLMERADDKISIICTYNENEAEVEYTKAVWTSMVELWESKDMLLDIMDEEISEVYRQKNQFCYSNNNIETYYVQLANMYHFMCYEQAEHYLGIIYHKFEVEHVDIDIEKEFNFLELYATVAMYMKKSAEALLYLNRMSQLLVVLDDVMLKNCYHLMAAQIYMYSSQQELAKQHISECRNCMKEIDDEYMLFRINLLEHMIFFTGWQSIWMLNVSIEGLEDLISNCIKYGYNNHLAHIYVYAFDNERERYSNLAGLNIKMPHFLDGLKIAKKIGNYYFMIDAYKKNVLLASTYGYYNTANYFSEKIRQITIKYDNDFELANNYNSMGYNCCVIEEYEMASEHYNQALQLFMKQNDIDSVNETVYNLAINAMMAYDFKTADQLFQLCLKCVHLIKANSVRVCNISKIYGLRAYCNYKLGSYYNTMINLQYAEQFMGRIMELEDENVDAPHLWDDDLAIFYMVSALLDAKNKQYDRAYVKLKKGRKFVDRAVGSKFIFFCPYALTYAKIAKIYGEPDVAEAMLEEVKRYCKENNFKKRYEYVCRAIQGEEVPMAKMDLGLKTVSAEEIVEKAEHLGLARDYKSQKEDLDFLGIWQKILNNQSKDCNQVLENAFVTLMNQYNLDDFLFIRMENDKPVLKYKHSNTEFSKETLWYIIDYFNDNRSPFKTSRLDKGYTRYHKFIKNCFGFNSICTFIAVPIFINEKLNSVFLASVQMKMEWDYKSKRYIFDNDDLSVFVVFYHHVLDYIERMEAQMMIAKANDRLKIMAVKDQLTGLYNRQGLNEIFKGSFDKIAIIYADLDNFKYYNDTFGHDIGDRVLVQFAKLLGTATSQRAEAVRYGGDEFLLIMYTDDRELVENAVLNVYEKLENFTELEEDISTKLGYPVEIPKEKRLSCSIGIAMGAVDDGDDRREQIDVILKKADTMMYRIKHTTKHTYTFFS